MKKVACQRLVGYMLHDRYVCVCVWYAIPAVSTDMLPCFYNYLTTDKAAFAAVPTRLQMLAEMSQKASGIVCTLGDPFELGKFLCLKETILFSPVERKH